MSREKVALNGSIFGLNGQTETIVSGVFRYVYISGYERIEVHTPDDDILDVDILKGASNRWVVLSHGLEGNSQRPYMKGMAKILNHNGYNVLAWNYRSCSRPNRQKIFYHSGATYDLNTVVEFILKNYSPQTIDLIGFSLGGNLTLKFLGEGLYDAVKYIRKAAAVSVPLDLKDCCEHILKPKNRLYHDRFLKSLREKVQMKSDLGFEYNLDKLYKIKDLYEFDEYFTAPVHGFENADDYYQKCSSKTFVENISIPTLIFNAKNDSFFSVPPEDFLKKHPFVHMEITNRGGHVGFPSPMGMGFYESEKRILKHLGKA